MDENEETKSDRKRKIIIGVVVVVVIGLLAIPILLLKPSESNGEDSSAVTLETVNADVESLQTWKGATDETLTNLLARINSLKNTVDDIASPGDWIPAITAIQTDIDDLGDTITGLQEDLGDIEITDWSPAVVILQEELDAIQGDIAGLNTTIAGLQKELDDTEIVDWAPTIAALQDEIGSLQSDIDNLVMNWASNTSMVTRVEGEYVDITVPGDGDYPVIVTLYGKNIGIETVQVHYSDAYGIEASWACNGTALVFLVVEPVAEWEEGDIIELRVTEGDVLYASAVIGEGWVESVPEW